MSAEMIIDQAGLPAGVAGEAREDGLDTGALVTLTSTAHVSTFRFRLSWTPQHPTPDLTAVASLAQASLTTYTFTPTAAIYGSFRVDLVTDEGTPQEDRQSKIFAIKQSPTAIRIPAANEVSDPDANLITATPAQLATFVGRSDFNAPDGVVGSPFELGTYVSWWRALADAIHTINAGSGGGGSWTTTTQAAPYTVLAADRVVLISGAGALNMPDPATYQGPLVVKFTAGAGPITVTRFGAEDIDGVAADDVLVAPGQSRIYVPDGTDWWVI